MARRRWSALRRRSDVKWGDGGEASAVILTRNKKGGIVWRSIAATSKADVESADKIKRIGLAACAGAGGENARLRDGHRRCAGAACLLAAGADPAARGERELPATTVERAADSAATPEAEAMISHGRTEIS